jgi:hypothetical protein
LDFEDGDDDPEPVQRNIDAEEAEERDAAAAGAPRG